MEREQSCEERIGEHLAGRLQHIDDLVRVAHNPESADGVEGVKRLQEAGEIDGALTDPEELREAAMERGWELPLAVSEAKVWTILLSTGGPHDEFRVTADSDGDITRIEYAFMDWFDGATRPLEGQEFDTIADYARSVIPDLQ